MNNSYIFACGLCSLLYVAVYLVIAGGPEWSDSRVRIVCPFTHQYVCLLVKNVSCSAVLRGAGRSGRYVPLIHTYIRGYTIICPKALETSVGVLSLDEAYGLQPTKTMTSARGLGHYSG